MSGWEALGFGQVDAINGVLATGRGRQRVTAHGSPILGGMCQDAVGTALADIGAKVLGVNFKLASSRIGDSC